MAARPTPLERRRAPDRAGPVTALLGELSRLSARLLRRSRRRAALAALTRAGRARQSVLVICHGNLFRSPFAAAVLQRSLARWGLSSVRVDSAGLAGAGRPSPAGAVAAAARRGIDLTGHTSQLAIADLVRAADVILVMDELQRRTICERFGRAPRDVMLLGDFDPAPAASRAIEDPVEQSSQVCDWVYARIERCVEEVGQALGRRDWSARALR